MMKLAPSEEWPPYRYLWDTIGPRVGLPREPWTHVLRRHPLRYLSVVVPLLAVIVLYCIRSKPVTSFVLAFLIGLLTGHIYW